MASRSLDNSVHRWSGHCSKMSQAKVLRELTPCQKVMPEVVWASMQALQWHVEACA